MLAVWKGIDGRITSWLISEKRQEMEELLTEGHSVKNRETKVGMSVHCDSVTDDRRLSFVNGQRRITVHLTDLVFACVGSLHH